MRSIVTFLLAFVLLLSTLLWGASARATDIPDGTAIFDRQCAGCHLNGGNIVRRGKNLKMRALQRNKMDSVEAIADLVTNGKNNMSAYGDRLTPEEIYAVSHYVFEQAENNWQ